MSGAELVSQQGSGGQQEGAWMAGGTAIGSSSEAQVHVQEVSAGCGWIAILDSYLDSWCWRRWPSNHDLCEVRVPRTPSKPVARQQGSRRVVG